VLFVIRLISSINLFDHLKAITHSFVKVLFLCLFFFSYNSRFESSKAEDSSGRNVAMGVDVLNCSQYTASIRASKAVWDQLSTEKSEGPGTQGWAGNEN